MFRSSVETLQCFIALIANKSYIFAIAVSRFCLFTAIVSLFYFLFITFIALIPYFHTAIMYIYIYLNFIHILNTQSYKNQTKPNKTTLSTYLYTHGHTFKYIHEPANLKTRDMFSFMYRFTNNLVNQMPSCVSLYYHLFPQEMPRSFL